MKFLRRMQPWLGTLVEIGIESGPGATRAATAAFECIADIHRLLSFQDPDSDLSRLNRANGKPVELDPRSVTVLRLARRLMRVTRGCFDCTVGGALERLGALPSPDTDPVLDHGDADDIVILDRRTVRLRRPVHVTLDGIAKGFAVDRAMHAIRAHGIGSAWVNAGGDLRVVGQIRLPLVQRGADGFCLIGQLCNGAAATSTARRYADASFPGRIISTRGPAVALGSWTVLARQAWRADALTKLAAQLPDSGRAVTIERLGGQLIRAETQTL